MAMSKVVDFAAIPAATPPPGITPDFDNSEELRVPLTVIIGLCMVVASLLLALRMISRAVIVKTIDWSDYSSILGYVFTMAFMGVALEIDEIRRGRHMWNMSLQDYLQTTHLENIASIMYCVGIGFSKLSILLFFGKVLIPTRRGAVYWINLALIILNCMFYSGSVIALILQCVPRAKISDPRRPGRCIDLYASFLISGVWNTLSDFFILVFPIWLIWQLQVPRKRKFYISIVFLTGTFALVASILRLHSTAQTLHNRDLTWIVAQVAIFTSAEMTLVLLCGCFPFLPKLVRSVKESEWAKRYGKSSQFSGGSWLKVREAKPPLPAVSEVELVGRGKGGGAHSSV